MVIFNYFSNTVISVHGSSMGVPKEIEGRVFISWLIGGCESSTNSIVCLTDGQKADDAA